VDEEGKVKVIPGEPGEQRELLPQGAE